MFLKEKHKKRKGGHMIDLLEISPSNTECNNPEEYNRLTAHERTKLQNWINTHIKPYEIKKFNPYQSSYGLKHLFEYDGGFYLTNGQFKKAMLLAGFEPENYNAKNWVFKLSRRVETINRMR